MYIVYTSIYFFIQGVGIPDVSMTHTWVCISVTYCFVYTDYWRFFKLFQVVCIPLHTDLNLKLVQVNHWQLEPVPKADRKCCVKFRTTPSVRTGFPAVIQHSLSVRAFKMSKTKNLKRSNFGQSVFLERKMRSAAKRVEQSLGYWYLSGMEWFSLRPRHFYA